MEAATKGRKGGVTRQPTTEEYKPPSDWTQDPTNHVLLLDVTGFKKDDLKLQVDNFDKITVSGERSVSENKRIWFKQNFQVPEDSDVSKISGKFDNGLLFVIMPKKETEKKDEDQKAALKDPIKEEMPKEETEKKVSQKDGTKEETPKKETEKKDEDQKAALKDPIKEEMPKEETEKKVSQKDGTKEETPKKETEKKVTQKDGTKEVMPTEKREEIQKVKITKEGMPTGKEPEKVQKEKAMEEAKQTLKEQDKTMEEGMPKEGEEVQGDITSNEGIPTEEEEVQGDITANEGIPTEEEMSAKEKEEEPEEDGGSREGSKDGPKDGSDAKKEESKMEGGREEVKKKCGEWHRIRDFGEKMYERGKEVLGDDFCDRAMKKINDNKAIIATAAVAFSLGFYVSSKLRRRE